MGAGASTTVASAAAEFMPTIEQCVGSALAAAETELTQMATNAPYEAPQMRDVLLSIAADLSRQADVRAEHDAGGSFDEHSGGVEHPPDSAAAFLAGLGCSASAPAQPSWTPDVVSFLAAMEKPEDDFSRVVGSRGCTEADEEVRASTALTQLRPCRPSAQCPH